MPKRFLKPGITTSENWNACDWETQSFYVRLITLVDDYGRYDGRPQVLKAHAFPLSEKITATRVEKMCAELVENGLATFYRSENKIVVQLLRWEERVRSESKFPAFDSNCAQMYANARKCAPPSPSPSPSPVPTPTPTDAASAAEAMRGLDFPQNLRTPLFLDAWEKWVPVRKRMKSCKDWESLFQAQLNWLGKFPEQTAIGIINQSIRNGWQGLFELRGNSNAQPPTNPRNIGVAMDVEKQSQAIAAAVAAQQAKYGK